MFHPLYHHPRSALYPLGGEANQGAHVARRRYTGYDPELSRNYVQTGYNARPRCRLVEATSSSLSRAVPSSSSSSTPLLTLPLDVGSSRWPRFCTPSAPSCVCVCVHGLTINALIPGRVHDDTTRRLAYTTEVNKLRAEPPASPWIAP